MAFERLQAEIGILLGQINNQPQDLHELYEQLHQKLNEMKALNQPLPADLVELEKKLLKEFPKAGKTK
jgi:hypothetical protein